MAVVAIPRSRSRRGAGRRSCSRWARTSWRRSRSTATTPLARPDAGRIALARRAGRRRLRAPGPPDAGRSSRAAAKAREAAEARAGRRVRRARRAARGSGPPRHRRRVRAWSPDPRDRREALGPGHRARKGPRARPARPRAVVRRQARVRAHRRREPWPGPLRGRLRRRPARLRRARGHDGHQRRGLARIDACLRPAYRLASRHGPRAGRVLPAEATTDDEAPARRHPRSDRRAGPAETLARTMQPGCGGPGRRGDARRQPRRPGATACTPPPALRGLRAAAPRRGDRGAQSPDCAA